MSASVVAATVIAIFLAVGGDTEEQMPRISSAGEILEEQCGKTHHCDFDDGSPECFVEKSRGQRCERNIERLNRMEMMEPPRPNSGFKKLFEPTWVPSDQPTANGTWIKLQL